MSIYVNNLANEVVVKDLNELFSEYDLVMSVQLLQDSGTGRPCGFAFVKLETDAGETAAIEVLNGAEMMGRRLEVSKAQPKDFSRIDSDCCNASDSF
jgi:RNA recognition motif-containing protein